jgi:mitochondrial fission protein ELM1
VATSRLGGSLAIVTSRRTPEACIAAMRAAAPSAHLHEWRADRADNPYVSYLAHADHLVVTGESESMLAEAVAASLPVTIYPLEPRPPAMSARWAWKLRRAAGLKPGLARWLVGNGWVPVPRDLALMHERLCSQGLARMFDGTVNTAAPRATDELVALTQRIRALLPGDHDRVA